MNILSLYQKMLNGNYHIVNVLMEVLMSIKMFRIQNLLSSQFIMRKIINDAFFKLHHKQISTYCSRRSRFHSDDYVGVCTSEQNNFFAMDG